MNFLPLFFGWYSEVLLRRLRPTFFMKTFDQKTSNTFSILKIQLVLQNDELNMILGMNFIYVFLTCVFCVIMMVLLIEFMLLSTSFPEKNNTMIIKNVFLEVFDTLDLPWYSWVGSGPGMKRSWRSRRTKVFKSRDWKDVFANFKASQDFLLHDIAITALKQDIKGMFTIHDYIWTRLLGLVVCVDQSKPGLGKRVFQRWQTHFSQCMPEKTKSFEWEVWGYRRYPFSRTWCFQFSLYICAKVMHDSRAV